jgi:hypothetical protein
LTSLKPWGRLTSVVSLGVSVGMSQLVSGRAILVPSHFKDKMCNGFCSDREDVHSLMMPHHR